MTVQGTAAKLIALSDINQIERMRRERTMWALRYAHVGWRVFPLCSPFGEHVHRNPQTGEKNPCTSPGKVPLIRWQAGATTDPGMTGILQQSRAPFVLLRIRVDGRESLQGFVQSLPW